LGTTPTEEIMNSRDNGNAVTMFARFRRLVRVSETPAPNARTVLTPSQLNSVARELIEAGLGLVWVEGELSNVARPASGHLYFTLKDAQAQVRCAMFKPKSTFLRFRPDDGLRVLARARPSIYEPRGDFQLIVDHLEEAGEGALRREFERLKAKLAAEGLFDTGRKRPLPRMPRRLAVITSPTGAAVRDVLAVLRRRWPAVHLDVLAVSVQGEGAATQMIDALAAAARAGCYDVLLLTRGGGSLEDLWCYNDERLARAIAASPVPVVSAVGHEVDVTLADFAADLRAPTPSAAAELLVPDVGAWRATLDQRHTRLRLAMTRRLRERVQRVDALARQLAMQRPQQRLASLRQRLMAARDRLPQALRARVQVQRVSLNELARRAPRALSALVQTRRAQWTSLGRTLHAISPLATLDRGYAIVFDAESGAVLRSVTQTTSGQTVRARMADGEIDARVARVRPRGSTPG
jgi:exodeoxyribonuclease VII large subunit